MLALLTRLCIVWDKAKFLSLVKLERDYIATTYAAILAKDEKALRKKLAEIKEKKDKTDKDQQAIADLDAEITEILQYRQMIEKSKEKEKDLEKQLAMYKKRLWR